MAAEEAAQKRVLLRRGSSSNSSAEWGIPGCLACVLLPVVHLLLELLGLLLVDERQAGEAFLELEGVKEDAVLVVVPCVVDLLVPYHASIP